MTDWKIDDPGTKSLVDGVAERAAAGLDGNNLGAEELHAEHVEGLAAHVLGAHVDGALHAELGADSRRRDTVLAGACFGDNLGLSEALRQQELTQRIVDLS
ncbi:hypothetical protein HYQ46_000023 [Verticillium longisporum]|nr:hypothetical protein HYQ46_000023 [Verticillium longisporum]